MNVSHKEENYEISSLEFLTRRKKFISYILNQFPSHLVLIFGNLLFEDHAPTCFFQQDPNFFYLTGLTEPNLILTFFSNSKKAEIIIHSSQKAKKKNINYKWIQSLSTRESAAFQWLYHSSFKDFQNWCEVKIFQKNPTLPILTNLDSRKKSQTFSSQFALQNFFGFKNSKKKYSSCLPILHSLRQHKSEMERLLIKKATRFSAVLHEKIRTKLEKKKFSGAAVRFKTDLDIQAWIQSEIIKISGFDLSYFPIILVGQEGKQLHGMATGQSLFPSDVSSSSSEENVLLMDFAVSYHGYHSDLTRTLFLQNKKNELQTFYYNLVKRQLDYVSSCIRPGIYILKMDTLIGSSLQTEAFSFLEKELIHQKDVKKMTQHAIGHHVGLETHDPEEDCLQPGDLIALETGYYSNLYSIRIENIYLVTLHGGTLLTESTFPY